MIINRRRSRKIMYIYISWILGPTNSLLGPYQIAGGT
jgi:hypothetical protein